jgi:hypothetical protein
MVARAGGEPVLGHKGGHAEVTMWDAVREEAPTIVVVAPCGYHLAEATEQARAVLAEVATTPAGRNKEVWAIDADAEVVRPGPRLVDGLELLAWLIAGGRGTRLTRTRHPRQRTQTNRLWSVTDAFEPAVHRPGPRGIELRSGTRTDRRGTHRPGWEGIAFWSYVRSIDRAKDAKSSERAPLIVTPIRKPHRLTDRLDCCKGVRREATAAGPNGNDPGDAAALAVR